LVLADFFLPPPMAAEISAADKPASLAIARIFSMARVWVRVCKAFSRFSRASRSLRNLASCDATEVAMLNMLLNKVKLKLIPTHYEIQGLFYNNKNQ